MWRAYIWPAVLWGRRDALAAEMAEALDAAVTRKADGQIDVDEMVARTKGAGRGLHSSTFQFNLGRCFN
jgi:hypothetical protein